MASACNLEDKFKRTTAVVTSKLLPGSVIGHNASMPCHFIMLLQHVKMERRHPTRQRKRKRVVGTSNFNFTTLFLTFGKYTAASITSSPFRFVNGMSLAVYLGALVVINKRAVWSDSNSTPNSCSQRFSSSADTRVSSCRLY